MLSPLRGWLPSLGMVAVVLIGGIASEPALRDAATLRPADARLALSPAFLALAPLNNICDALSLLSLRQHLALLATVALLYAVWRFNRSRPTVGGEVRAALIALLAVLLIYALGVFMPRPMAALRLPGADALAVDFHSHTDASHDGRRGFTDDANRAWHRRAGFDVAYITDHSRFSAALQAASRNPRQAGEGTVLLSGVECIVGREHVVVLGATAVDSAALLRGRDCDPAHVGDRPIIETMPGHLDAVVGRPRVQGIELSDAAPRGLDAIDQDRARILALADSLGLAVVSGSDNHGFGWTAAAWSVLVIPGWRVMSADSLAGAITGVLLTRGRHAVAVIERTRPETVGAIAPAVAWTMIATLSWPERTMWIVWALGLGAVGAWRRRARA